MNGDIRYNQMGNEDARNFCQTNYKASINGAVTRYVHPDGGHIDLHNGVFVDTESEGFARFETDFYRSASRAEDEKK